MMITYDIVNLGSYSEWTVYENGALLISGLTSVRQQMLHLVRTGADLDRVTLAHCAAFNRALEMCAP